MFVMEYQLDSMVMLDLFEQAGATISVAHVNHSTRAGASDQDAQFIRTYCQSKGIPYHELVLDYDELSKGNFQQNARQARYRFFKQLCHDHGYTKVATAHHLDDRWETFLMNLNRKSGLKGLASISAMDGRLIRPMLMYSRKQIEEYAVKHKISYREDASNASDDYLRNRVRHQITPKVIDIFPQMIEHANTAMDRIASSQSLITELIARMSLMKRNGNRREVDRDKVKSFATKYELGYQLLSPFGFSAMDIRDMVDSDRNGAYFSSVTYEAVIHGTQLLIQELEDDVNVDIEISGVGDYSLPDGRVLNVSTISAEGKSHLRLSKNAIKWPLLIRSRKDGDTFRPHGMDGRSKKLRNYLSDEKINRLDRQKVLILESEETIIQVIGLRTAHGFLASEGEESIYVEIV